MLGDTPFHKDLLALNEQLCTFHGYQKVDWLQWFNWKFFKLVSNHLSRTIDEQSCLKRRGNTVAQRAHWISSGVQKVWLRTSNVSMFYPEFEIEKPQFIDLRKEFAERRRLKRYTTTRSREDTENMNDRNWQVKIYSIENITCYSILWFLCKLRPHSLTWRFWES